MSGGGSSMIQNPSVPAVVATHGMPQVLPNPQAIEFPTSIPSFLGNTASQLAKGFGDDEESVLQSLEALYSPMSAVALQYPISVYAAQEGNGYQTDNPVLDLLLNGRGRAHRRREQFPGGGGRGR